MQTWSDEQQDLGGNKGLTFPFLFASIFLPLFCLLPQRSPACTVFSTFMLRKLPGRFFVCKNTSAEQLPKRTHFQTNVQQRHLQMIGS